MGEVIIVPSLHLYRAACTLPGLYQLALTSTHRRKDAIFNAKLSSSRMRTYSRVAKPKS